MKNRSIFLLLSALTCFTVEVSTLNYVNFIDAAAQSLDPISGASHYDDPNLYYKGISETSTGLQLMEDLEKLTRHGHIGHSYDSLKSLYHDCDMQNGKMRMCYTGSLVDVNSTSGLPSSVNREHVWPASWYGQENGRLDKAGTPGADAHNILPCASFLNNKRHSCAFDDLEPSETKYKAGEFSENDLGYAEPNNPDSYVYTTVSGRTNVPNDGAIMPAKGERGRIARCLLYVATSYRNAPGIKPRLYDERNILKEGKVGRLSTILKWHFTEPPTDFEIERNNYIAEFHHHTRNPFIDHPEYAARIYSNLPEPGQSAPSPRVLEVIEKYGNYEPVEAESIEIANKNITIGKNEKCQIESKVLPDNASQFVVYESDNLNIAKVDSKGFITGVNKGECNIKVSSYSFPKVFGYVHVKVKEMTKIVIEGQAKNTVYEEGDSFNPTGLIVKGIYDDSSTRIIPNDDCKWLDKLTQSQSLTFGATSVLCIYQNKQAIYTGITVNKCTKTGFELIDDPRDDYSGEYLIATQLNKGVIALNGAESIAKSNNNNLNIPCDKVSIKDESYKENTFKFEKIGEYYKITSKKGEVLGANSSSNLSQSPSYLNKIYMDKEFGNIIIECNALTLRYNSGNFRYYSNDNLGNAIYLYKSIDFGKNNADLEAYNYAQNFMEANVCGTNDNTKAISSKFLKQKELFEKLSPEAKGLLLNATADKDSLLLIEQCVAKYDRIIFLHGDEKDLYPDFMNRKGKIKSKNAIVKAQKSDLTPVLIIGASIFSIALIGSTILGIYLILRKKNS